MIVRLALTALLVMLAQPQVGMAADAPREWTRAALLAISDQELQKSGIDPNQQSLQMQYIDPGSRDYASLVSTIKAHLAEWAKAADEAEATGKPFVRPPSTGEFTGHGIWDISYSSLDLVRVPHTGGGISVYIDDVTGHVLLVLLEQ